MVPLVAKLVVKTRLKSTSNASATYTPRSRNQLTTVPRSNEVSAAAVLLIGVPPLGRLRSLITGYHAHQVLLGEFVAGEGACDGAVSEDYHPVGAFYDLLGLRVDHDHP